VFFIYSEIAHFSGKTEHRIKSAV